MPDTSDEIHAASVRAAAEREEQKRRLRETNEVIGILLEDNDLVRPTPREEKIRLLTEAERDLVAKIDSLRLSYGAAMGHPDEARKNAAMSGIQRATLEAWATLRQIREELAKLEATGRVLDDATNAEPEPVPAESIG